MKISNSKKELARIISENGGWRDGEFSVMCSDKTVLNSSNKPFYDVKHGWCCAGGFGGDRFESAMVAKNWHQTILSRAEYFHLYPAPDADGWIEWNGGECPVDADCIVSYKMRNAETFKRGEPASEARWSHNGVATDIIAYRLHKPEQSKPEFCESVMRSIPEPEAKPTIEQLIQTYADRAHGLQLANEHLATCVRQANEAMDALSIACKAAGFDISPITAKQEPELVITDWRDLMTDDVISIHCFDDVWSESKVIAVGCDDVLVKHHTGANRLVDLQKKKWEFIRRP